MFGGRPISTAFSKSAMYDMDVLLLTVGSGIRPPTGQGSEAVPGCGCL
jgi:hypothetical protein